MFGGDQSHEKLLHIWLYSTCSLCLYEYMLLLGTCNLLMNYSLYVKLCDKLRILTFRFLVNSLSQFIDNILLGKYILPVWCCRWVRRQSVVSDNLRVSSKRSHDPIVLWLFKGVQFFFFFFFSAKGVQLLMESTKSPCSKPICTWSNFFFFYFVWDQTMFYARHVYYNVQNDIVEICLLQMSWCTFISCVENVVAIVCWIIKRSRKATKVTTVDLLLTIRKFHRHVRQLDTCWLF